MEKTNPKDVAAGESFPEEKIGQDKTASGSSPLVRSSLEATPSNKEGKVKKAGEKDEFNINIEEMAQSGLQFGHRTSKLHPKMEPYVFGVKNTIHIINLEKTKEELEKALKFIKELTSEGKTLLLVGTKIQFKNLIKEMAQELGLPYVAERWLGGTFTNFEVMKKRTAHLKELELKISNPAEMEKYTKKERLDMGEELRDLKLKFDGIKDLDKLPDAIFVVDTKEDFLAVKEANQKGIKVVAISDTNCDPSPVDYSIPANDDAIPSVQYILGKVKEVAKKAKPK